MIQQEEVNFRWLVRRILRHKRAAAGAFIFGVFSGVSTAVEPYLIGRLIERIGAGAAMDETWTFVGAILVLAIFNIYSFNRLRYYSGEVAYSVDYDLRHDLFDNMLTLDQNFYRKYTSGDLISRMHNDMMVIWRLHALGFLRTGTAIFMLLATFILLSFVNFPLTLLVFVILSISTAIQVRAGLALADLSERVQDQAGRLAGFVQDSVSGILTIKTIGREPSVATQYHKENTEYRRLWLKFRRRNEPVGMLPNGVSELTAAVVVMLGGVMAINGDMTIGQFTSFLLYLGVVSIWLLNLGTVYQRWQQAKAALSRIAPLSQPAEIADVPGAASVSSPKGAIEFRNVSLELGGAWVLRDVSLSIKPGETVAIVGPTGSGKSQLVNLLARVSDPTKGQILLDGTDIREILLSDLREAIAYVPQSTFLFSRQLRENILMGFDSANERDLLQAIAISRLSNDLSQIPHGLETLVGERGVMLSGGQKQRVAIARAVIRDPAVLVLDDALSSVDTHTAAEILSELRHVVRSRTSIIIAHRVASVKDADRILVMEGGHLVEEGTHDELVKAGGFYTKLVDREMALGH